MLKLKKRRNTKIDDRTWWKCPTCKYSDCIFVAQIRACEVCGTLLPNFEKLMLDKETRIKFHHAVI